MVAKLTIPKRIESLNKLVNMHRMARHSYNKKWHAAVKSASLSYPTGADSLTRTICQAEENLSSTLSAMQAT